MTLSTNLQRAYAHSRLNRRFMVSGADCRCFHCLHAFSAEQISHWVDNGETALCPNCGVDAVLSGQADCISEGLIGELKKTVTAKLVEADVPIIEVDGRIKRLWKIGRASCRERVSSVV